MQVHWMMRIVLFAILACASIAFGQWPNGYTYSGTITIAHTQVPNTDQANFPVLISGTYPDLATTANGGKVTSLNGYDIIFTSDANGLNKLNFEREMYSPSTGQVVYWVRVPNLSHTTDTVIYAFYGNAAVTTDQSNKSGTWDSNYKAAYHLGESTGPYLDSTSSNATATTGSFNPTQVTGKIGKGQQFTAANNQYLGAPNTVISGSSLMLEGWLNVSSPGSYPMVIDNREQGALRGGALYLDTAASNHAAFYINNVANVEGTVNLADGAWHHLVGTYDGATMKLYVDGTLVNSGGGGNFAGYAAGTVYLGRAVASSTYTNGTVDEVRVSNLARSADWVATEYSNQNNPASFYSVVWGQTSGGTPPVSPGLSVSSTSLTYTGQAGSSNPAAQSVNITNSGGGTLNWTATATQPWMTLATTANGAGSSTLSGTGAQTIWIQIVNTGLAAGPYSGAVNLTAPGAAPASQTVNVSLTVSAGGVPPSPWPNGYSYSGTITVSHTQVSNTDQASFPVLISGTYPDLATTANGGKVTSLNGYDIIFTSDANGLNKLNFEREMYSPSTGQVVYWVRVPNLSHTTDTVIYAFYGNAAVTTDQSNKSGTWDSNFRATYHLSESASPYLDSTSNANFTGSAIPTQVNGKIGKGQQFNAASSQYLSAPETITSGSLLTLEGWLNVSSPGSYPMVIDNREQGALRGGALYLDTAANNHAAFYINNVANVEGTVNLADGAWHHLVGTYDGATMKLYVDGTLVNSGGGGNFAGFAAGTVYLGRAVASSTYTNGTVDEVRVSNLARSADWVATEYSNQNNPASFYSVVWGQTSGGTPPVSPGLSVSSTSLTYTGQAGSSNPAAQSVNITNSGGGTLNWTATATQSWMTLATTANGAGSSTLSGTGAQTIWIQIVNTGLVAGPYSGAVNLTAPGAAPASQTVNVSLTVSAGGVPPSPWPNGYSYSGTITVSHTQVSNTDQANFPVLIAGTYPDLATTANGGKVTSLNGYDIIFTSDANGLNKLNFEREMYSPSTGQVVYWVRVPNLSHTTDTVIYAFYGNAAVTTDQSNKSGTWDSNYKAAYHLGESTGPYLDSTSSNATATTGSFNPTQVTGKIGKGQQFTAANNQYLGAPNTVISGSSLMLEGWLNVSSPGSYPMVIDNREQGALRGGALYLDTAASNHAAFYINNVANVEGTVNLADGAWHHLVGTYDGATMKLYVDGALVNSGGGGNFAGFAAGTVYLGRAVASSTYTNGTVDEVRVSNLARSADWVATEYSNQNNPASFYSVVWGQTSGGTPPVSPGLSVSSTSLTYSSQAGASNPAAQSVNITNSGGGTLNWTATATQPWMTLATTANGAGSSTLSGTGAQTIWIQIVNTGLAAGPYSGAVNLTAPGAVPSSQTVNVSLTLTAPPGLSVSSSSLTYSGQAGASNPAAQSVNITNSGGGTLNWTATATQPWMTLATTANGAGSSTLSGTGAQTIWIQIVNTGLAAGPYSGAVNLTAPGAVPSSQTVNVSLTLTAPPGLSVSSSSLTYSGQAGASNPAAQSVNITNSGGGTLNWTATATQPWMTLATTANGAGSSTLSGTGAQTIWIQIVNTGLAAGPYSGAVNLTAPGAAPASQTVNVSLTVSAGGVPPSPWPNGYSYSGTITVSHTQVSNTDQASFPVLISGTYPDLATTANGGKVTSLNGYDIIFTSDANGLNKLNFEREMYSPSTGQVVYWVRVPNLSHTTDTVIYAFYGNAAVTTDQSNKSGTWDSNFRATYHLSESASPYLDSTSNANFTGSAIPTQVNGKIGKGQQFNAASSQYLSAPETITSGSLLTLEGWLNVSSPGSYPMVIDNREQGALRGGALYLDTAANNHAAFYINNVANVEGTVNLADGAWHHLVGTYDGATMKLYVDGTLVNSGGGGNFAGFAAGTVYLGRAVASSTYTNGTVDEVRVSNLARSADWVATEYSNQNNPASFYSVVWGQTSGGTPPVSPGLSVSSTSLTYTGQAGSSNPAAQSVNITNSGGGTLNWTATATQSWMTLATTANGAGSSTLSGTGAQTIWIQIVNTGLVAGPYSGAVNLTAPGAAPASQTVNVSLTVSAGGAPPSWPNGYTYSGRITLAHTQVANTDQANFPVLISGTYPSLATTANGGKVTNASAYDIIFTSDANGLNKLNFEREMYSPSTGQVVYWVQVPNLSHTTDTVIYAFYGNAAVTTDQSNKSGTWDSNFRATYHLSESASPYLDSTSNANFTGSAIPTQVNGKIGKGQQFNAASSQYLSAPETITSGSLLTLEGWLNVSSPGSYPMVIDNREQGALRGGALYLDTAANNHAAFYINNVANVEGTVNLADGAWHHLVGTYDGATMKLYVDGALVNSGGGGNFAGFAAGTVYLGRAVASSTYTNGTVDEVRVSNLARSADWVATEYSNQNNPASFYAVSWDQTSGNGTPGLSVSGSSSLTYSGQATASNPAAQPVNITNSGAGTLNWTATATQPWITLATTANGAGTSTLSGTGAQTIWIQIANNGLGAGPYSGAVNITAAGATPSSQTVNVSLTLTPAPVSAWQSGYNYSGTITIAHGQVPNTDQANFPVLISGTYPDLANIASGGKVINPNGYDIIFASDASGFNRLNFERESYSSANGQVLYWVQVPNLSHTTDTVIYAFYGSPLISTDQSNKSTWDSNFMGVWHLDGNPAGAAPQERDSTPVGHDLTAIGSWSAANGIPGEIGNAIFSTTNSGFAASTSLGPSTSMTLGAWIKINYTGFPTILGQFDGSNFAAGYLFQVNGATSNLRLKLSAGNNGGTDQTTFDATAGTVNDGNWHYIAATYDNATGSVALYVDGIAVPYHANTGITSFHGSLASTYGVSLIPFRDYYYQNGVVDEARMSGIARSADWIATEYSNQSNPSSFYSAVWGLVSPLPPALSVSSSSLSYSGQALASNPAAQSVNITNAGGSVLNWTATSTQPWITLSTTANGVGTSTLSGTGPKTIWIQIANTGLAAGPYAGMVNITAPGATPSSQTVNVSLTLTAPPGVSVSSSSLSYSGQALASNPAAQSVNISNSGGGTLNWTATATQPWMTLATTATGAGASTLSGTGAQTIWIQIVNTGLAAGPYSGAVNINASGAAPSSQTVNVSLTLTPPPGVSISSSSLTYFATVGASNPVAQSVNITNSGGGTLNWTATVTQPWMALALTANGTGTSTLSGTGAQTIWIQVTSSALAVGPFSGAVNITAPAGAAPASQTVNTSLTVATPASLSAWANGYTSSGTFTIAHSQVPNTDQTNFPVLISGTYPALATVANGGKVTNANGYDIIFTSDANGMNVLNYERESYSPTNGQLLSWVQVPLLSHTTDTVIYVFYGNATVTTDQSNPSGTWDSNYLAVWHLGGNPGSGAPQEPDSTSNGHGLSTVGSWSIGNLTAGKIGNAIVPSSASNSSLAAANSATLSPTTSMTLGSWIKIGYGGLPAIMSQFDLGGAGAGYSFVMNGTTSHLRLSMSAGANGGTSQTTFDATAGNVNDLNWHYVAATYSDAAGAVTFYVDGAPVPAMSSTGSMVFHGNIANGVGFSLVPFQSYQFQGTIDEARVSKTARSADWIATDYNSQNNPSSFYSPAWSQTLNLFYSAVSGLGNPAPQAVNISNSGGSPLNWTATASQPWMTLSTTPNGAGATTISGTGAQTIWVQVSTASLIPGPYSGTVNITAPGAIPAAQTVNVSLTLAPPPSLSAAPTTIAFAGTAGAALTAQSVNITNSGGGTLNWTASVTQPWLALSTTANGIGSQTLSGIGPQTIWVQVVINGLNAGTYTDTVSINAPGATPSSQTVSISLALVGASGPVGYWTFDTGTIVGTTVLDSTLNHLNGTLVGGVTSTTGIIQSATGIVNNQALSFDGSSGNIAFGEDSLTDLTNDMSLALWIKTSNTSSTQALISRYSAAGSEFGYLLRTTPAGHVELRIGGNNLSSTPVVITDTGKLINDGQWHHVAAVISLGQGTSFYIDGVLTSTQARNIVANASGIALQIGTTNYPPYGTLFAGAMDDVRIYNRALQPAEIPILANPGAITAPAPPGPALWVGPLSFDFNGVSGGSNPLAQSAIIANIGGGTLNWTATASQPWVNLSTSFSGGGTSTLSGTGSQTIWIQPASTGLVSAQYNATVDISAAGAAPSSATIGISLGVVSSTTPSLWVAPSNLFFSATPGSSNPTAQSLSVSNTGGGTLTWTATTNQSWITLSSTSGAAGQTIAVGTVITGLVAGTYTGAVTVTAPGASPVSSQTINVTLAIVPALTPPTGGQTLSSNGIVLPQAWPPPAVPNQTYTIPTYITSPPAVIPIDVGRQLFVDDFLVQQTTMARTAHQPVMNPGNPIASPNAALKDTAGYNMPYSDGAWFDPADQTYKMWSDCGYGNMICYSYSTDGKNWIRPSFSDSVVPGTNFVLQIVGGRDSTTVWMDLQDVPARKFKAFAYYSGQIAAYFSSDGIHWSTPQYSFYSQGDRTTLHWNPFRNVWVESMRAQPTLPATPNKPAISNARVNYYVETTDFVNWKPADFTDSFWTSADEYDPPYVAGGALPQLYNLDAVGYESVMVGMFSWLHPGPADPGNDPSGAPGPALVELGVGFSRDGFNWVRPTRGGGPANAFIPASNLQGTWNMGNTQSTGGGFLVVGNELWFYFSGRNGPHGHETAGSTGMATLRRDGFYSMDAGSTEAVLTTRQVHFSGKYLFVNVNDPSGSLQVEVLDSNGNVIPAFARQNSVAVSVDSTLQQMTWNGVTDLSSLTAPGTSVQFRFYLTNGQLYSFWVSASTNGASNGYVGAGGPGYTGNVDNVGSGSLSASGGTTPNFTASASSLVFSAAAGSGNPAPQSVAVSDLGGTLSWTVTADQPWLTVSPPSGTGPQPILVTASIASLSVGAYSGTATIFAPGATPSSLTVSVSLTVTAGTAGGGGAQHYVGPNGSALGDGSINNPWDIQTALNQPAAVKPGDTIWLRNGTYGNGGTIFTSNLNGTGAQPIVLRQYPGERATVNGGFIVNGSNVWFWGFEVANLSVTNRITSCSGTNCNMMPVGFDIYAPGSKFINMVVHDTAQGFGFWTPATNAEIYGSLIYNNGWQGSDRGHGHGIYTQNQTGTKTIRNNIIFQGFGLGIQAYGSTNAYVQNYVFDGNTIFNAGTLTIGPNHDYNLLAGGGAGGPQNITATNNYTYHTPSAGLGLSSLGALGTQASNLIATNNYWIGGTTAITLYNWIGATFTNNIAYSQSNYVLLAGNLSPSTYTWNNNTYYGSNLMSLDGHDKTLGTWQQATGLDSNSTAPVGQPSGTWTFVRPNQYEPGRANITIYNWGLASTVPVDLSSILTVGSHFQVFNAQNFYGTPVVSANYTGNPVSIPMTGLTVAPAIGTVGNQPGTTGPQFAAFVMLAQ